MSNSLDFEYWCYTKDRKLKDKFFWKIENFTNRREMLVSSVFTSSDRNSRQWTIWLYPEGDGVSNKSHISVYINNKSKEEIWAKANFSVINNKGTVAISLDAGWHKFTSETTRGLTEFVKRDFVLNKENGVLHNDVLTIVCDIETREGTENRLEFVPDKFEPPLCRLAEDMGNLLSCKSLTDFTITVGERQFSAHKAILAARSPVFAAMFSNEVVEKKLSKVKITDIDPDVFQEMLEYIYTGNEISQTSKTKELLAAANKYQLDRLKFMCEDVLRKQLSLDNVLEHIALADCHNASYLKEYAINFALKNRNDLIGTSSWDDFTRSHQNLVVEMFEKIGI